MKKSIKMLIATVGMVCAMAVASFAGQWMRDANGWSYLNDTGAKAVGWQWIDSNGDGYSECYYFDEFGYCLMNTTTPDGKTVDASGAWTVNGIVQTQLVQAAQTTQTTVQQNTNTYSTNGFSGISSTPYDGYTIVVNMNSKKYHNLSCRAISDMNDKNKGYASDAATLQAQGFSPCKICH